MSLLFCLIKITIIAFKSMLYHTVKLICINDTGHKKISDTSYKIQQCSPLLISLTTEFYCYFYLLFAIRPSLQTHHYIKGDPVRLAFAMFLRLSFLSFISYEIHQNKFNLINSQLVFYYNNYFQMQTILRFYC